MIFLGYVLGVLLLHALLPGGNRRMKDLVIFGYNFFFAAGMFFARFAVFPMDLTAFLRVLGEAITKAPEAITFQGDASAFDSPDAFYIFFLMSLHTVRTALVFFFQQLCNDLQANWRLFFHQKVFVVVGNREDARAFLRDLAGECRKPAVIYIPAEPGEQGQKPFPGVCEREIPDLDKLRAGKQYEIVLLPGEGLRNYQLLRTLNRLGQRVPGLRVTAFLDSDLLRMEDLRFPDLDVYLVSKEGLAVQDLMERHLPLALLKEQDPVTPAAGRLYAPPAPFSLCMVGFDGYAREFLLETYEHTAFETAAGERGLRALIVDQDLTRKKTAFLHEFPRLAQERGISWMDTSPWSEDFYGALRERMGAIHQILVATPDTQENIRLAMELRRFFASESRKPQIVAAILREDQGAEALLGDDSGILLEQVNEKLFTYRRLVLRAADQEARALHRQYVSHGASELPWNELGTFTQASNRAAVWDLPNKRLLAGDVDRLSHGERETLYWELARYEHRRWSAFHYARGWTRLPVEELTAQERAAGITKRAGEKRHICLVEWDELDTLPQARPGLFKQYDYENVTALFDAKGESEAAADGACS